MRDCGIGYGFHRYSPALLASCCNFFPFHRRNSSDNSFCSWRFFTSGFSYAAELTLPRVLRLLNSLWETCRVVVQFSETLFRWVRGGDMRQHLEIVCSLWHNEIYYTNHYKFIMNFVSSFTELYYVIGTFRWSAFIISLRSTIYLNRFHLPNFSYGHLPHVSSSLFLFSLNCRRRLRWPATLSRRLRLLTVKGAFRGYVFTHHCYKLLFCVME